MSEMLHVGRCESCEWQQEYASQTSKCNGIKRHRDKTGHLKPVPPAPIDKWTTRAAGAYGTAERTPSEWVTRWNEQPGLFEDLLLVLTGSSLNAIEQDRRKERAARAA